MEISDIDIFTIMPIRKATEEELDYIKAYTERRERTGQRVYCPWRDNPYEQTDKIGLDICRTNRKAISEAKEIHVYYNSTSEGTKFDIGMATALGKNFRLINEGYVKYLDADVFANFLRLLSEGSADKNYHMRGDDVFIISPKRLDEKSDSMLDSYIARLRENNHGIYSPVKDIEYAYPNVPEVDRYQLNVESIRRSNETHVWWDPKDGDCIFQLGAAFALNKPIHLINKDNIRHTDYKSFDNVLLTLDSMHESMYRIE